LQQASYPQVLWRRFAKNYAGALLAMPFLQYLRNTLALVVLNIAAQLFSCSLIAFGFARLRWPGREWVFGLVLATMMLPPQVTMIPQFLIWRGLGQYDTLQPLWLPSLFGSGFFIFLMRQFMLTLPKDLEEAARIDGCGHLATYWHVVLPLLRPPLAAVGIFQFMGTWNDFLGPLIYLSSEDLAPLSLGLFRFQGSHFVNAVGEVGLLMAASLLMTLPVILLFFFAQRYFIQGITFTGMRN
jgi:multiple sugar transport system permease protein